MVKGMGSGSEAGDRFVRLALILLRVLNFVKQVPFVEITLIRLGMAESRAQFFGDGL